MPGIWRTVDISTLKYTYFASHCFGQIPVLATIFVFVFFWHCLAFIAVVTLLVENEIKLKLRWLSRIKLEKVNRTEEKKDYSHTQHNTTHTDLGHPKLQFDFWLAMEVDIDISWLSLLNEKCSKYEIKKKHSVSFFVMWGPSFLPALLPDGLWDGVAAATVEAAVTGHRLGHIVDLAQHLNCTWVL